MWKCYGLKHILRAGLTHSQSYPGLHSIGASPNPFTATWPQQHRNPPWYLSGVYCRHYGHESLCKCRQKVVRRTRPQTISRTATRSVPKGNKVKNVTGEMLCSSVHLIYRYWYCRECNKERILYYNCHLGYYLDLVV